MSGWAISTIVLACLLALSFLSIIINGTESGWTHDNYASIFLFIFLFPLMLPIYIWDKIQERKSRRAKSRASVTRTSSAPATAQAPAPTAPDDDKISDIETK